MEEIEKENPEKEPVRIDFVSEKSVSTTGSPIHTTGGAALYDEKSKARPPETSTHHVSRLTRWQKATMRDRLRCRDHAYSATLSSKD